MILINLFKTFMVSLFLSMAIIIPCFCANDLVIELSDGSEFQMYSFAAEGESLLVIFPSEHGITEGLNDLALKLSQSGIETWVADPFTTWFLPVAASSLQDIPIEAYAELISHAEKTKKKIYLLSYDKGASVVLEVARQWQSQSSNILSGVILISPDLYTATPTAGNDGTLSAIAQASNLPVYIYVPSKSTLALRIKDTAGALEKGGSDVYVQILPEVRNRFFFRDDASDVEQKLSQHFAQMIKRSMNLMRPFARQRKVSEAALAVKPAVTQKTEQTTGLLREYSGSLQQDNFTLKDISGNTHLLSQYKGKVVVVNFWASWCPPCVHEMPSMSELYNELNGKPFTILGINIGEEPAEIKDFISKYPVTFPVLLDPLKALPKKWKVFAFPTSYLLDKQGKIRYSIAGGIDWDLEELRTVIDMLMAEKYENKQMHANRWDKHFDEKKHF